MRRFLWLPLIVAVGVGALMLRACIQTDTWTADFPMEKDELVSTGRNPYFILEPGYSLVLEGGGAQLTITVLSETMKVACESTWTIVPR